MTNDMVWAVVASTIGVDVGLLVPTLYRRSVVVVSVNVTYFTSGRLISTNEKAYNMVYGVSS